MQNLQHYARKFKDITLEDFLLIDIRDTEDFQAAHIPQAIHERDLTHIAQLASQKPERNILLYCYHGNTAARYTAALLEIGLRNIYFLQENIEEFSALGIPLES